MASPEYNGGSDYGHRHGGNRHHRRSGQAPESTRVGWLDQVGAWLGGSIPSYAGQGTPVVGSGSPGYLPAPRSTGNSGAANVTPQPSAAVIWVPRG
jgi:hypothetical protein